MHPRFLKKVHGFTLIEILVAVSIVAVISIIGVSYGNSYKESQYNTKRIADIETLGNSLGAYYQIHNKYPEPRANAIYYDTNGIYMHSQTGSFGVSSFVSADLIPKEFMNYLPVDPGTSHFYAYGKRNDWTLWYDLAAVTSKNGEYQTYLRGTYNATTLVSLIREYNGPSFIYNGSTKALPYNPYELKITGQVQSYSGMTEQFRLMRNNIPEIFTGTIYEWDTLFVASGALATLYISDGSELNLGSATDDTMLEFSELSYQKDNNIVTKVALYLRGGETWVKAPKLNTSSDFTIQTEGALATVRGTVFGITNSADSTDITLESGKLEVVKINAGSPPTSFDGAGFTGTGLYLEGGKSYMQVKDWENPINLKVTSSTPTPIHSMATPAVITEKTRSLRKIHEGIIPKIFSFNKEGYATPLLAITFENIGANILEVKSGNNLQSRSIDPKKLTETVEGIEGFDADTTDFEIRLCNDEYGNIICTGSANLNVPEGTSFDMDFSNKWPRQALDCVKGSIKFASFGCQDEKLVAYAPFSEPGDIFLYNKDNKVFPMSSNGVLNNVQMSIDSMTDRSSLSPKDYIGTVVQCVPVKSGASAWFVSSNCNGIAANLSMLLWNPIYQNKASFFKFGDRKTAIYMDNENSTQDYIKYNLSSLDLWSKFSIEVTVRGAALKRTGENYFLWQVWENRLQLDNTGKLKFFSSKNGNANIFNGAPVNFVSYTIPTGTIKDQILYTISTTLWKKGDPIFISIKDDKGIVVWENGGSINLVDYVGFWDNKLWLWSPSYWTYQWNDLLSGLKIYKKQ